MFPIAIPSTAYPHASDNEFAATGIGHSTVLLQLGGLDVLTDLGRSREGIAKKTAVGEHEAGERDV